MILRFNSHHFGFPVIKTTSLLISLLLLCHHVKGQSSKVSSKLDFDDTEDKSNSSMPMQPGVGQQGRNGFNNEGNDSRGTSRGRGNANDRNDDDNNSNRGGGGSGGHGGGTGGKTGPKIHGVRVTVDTGDAKKSKESKESVEITDLGKHKKRVGIHTDITFEITADGEDVLNATSSAQRDKDEDASVPVYRGRGGHGHDNDSRHKSRKPYDPRTRWTRWTLNFSSERRYGYDSHSRGGGSSYYPSQYPSYNVPVYKNSGDATRSAGGSVYRQEDGWNNYVPSTAYWTTERSYSEHNRPNSVSGYQTGSGWKPCYCITYGTDNRRRRDSNQRNGDTDMMLKSKSSVIEVLDSKLDAPFSKK